MFQKTKVTDEIRLMAAYDSPAAEEMPMFAENRVHQRSSGNPYPNKVVMRVDRAAPFRKALPHHHAGKRISEDRAYARTGRPHLRRHG